MLITNIDFDAWSEYGFRTQKAYETALYHNLGNLPEPKFTHEFC